MAALAEAASLSLLILIRAADAAEPLHKPFEFFIGELSASFPHVDGENTPRFGGASFLVDPLDFVTFRASAVEESLRFGI